MPLLLLLAVVVVLILIIGYSTEWFGYAKPCSTHNNCVDLKPVNITGYGDGQLAVKCVGDVDYTNTILRNGDDKNIFVKMYDDITNATYPTTRAAVSAYCADPTRGGAYDQ